MSSTLKIYNTLTHEKGSFLPLEPDKVGMYVCGVTVYDSSHIGHARAAVVFDIVYRILQELGYKVTYVRNFTDIDDKIIQRSQELGIDYRELTQKYIDQYQEEMRLLNVLPPTEQPRATEHIDDMIKMIEGLIEKGYAYRVGDDVFFAVKKMKGYGKLSKRSIEELRSGSRVEVNDQKKNPLDFALWKSARPNEPYWESPWGKGRPGWHIECSAMSTRYLGSSFDIHGGGGDLIFPHHENEIAQSECFTDRTFARVWMHNELVTIQQSKMSKSLGNVFFLPELLDEYAPRVVRYFLISKHYRTPIDFSMDSLKDSVLAMDRIESTLARALEVTDKKGSKPDEVWIARFHKALCDDFNTPRAIGVLFQLLAQINTDLDKESPHDLIQKWVITLEKMLSLLGLQIDLSRFTKVKEMLEPDEAILNKILDKDNLTEEDMTHLVKLREGARKSKRWDIADRIRDQLLKKGLEIRDEKDGAKVVKKS